MCNSDPSSHTAVYSAYFKTCTYYNPEGASCLVAAGSHALLVVGGGLIVGVDDGVGGNTVGVVGLSPGVDGVDIVEHGGSKEGEHFPVSKWQQ